MLRVAAFDHGLCEDRDPRPEGHPTGRHRA